MLRVLTLLLAMLILTSCSNTENETSPNSSTEQLEFEIQDRDFSNNTNQSQYSTIPNTTDSNSITIPPLSSNTTPETNQVIPYQNTTPAPPVEKNETPVKRAKLTDDTPPATQNTSNKLKTYSTKVYTKTNNRVNNLKLACSKINGKIIKPGEVFSYNDIVGPFNKSNGYKKANILLSNGQDAQDYGGGVCQVSSTLYNAVKDQGVEIIERHNHSKDVYYVPKNEDAAVSYGSLNFKFKNTNSYSLKIEASADKNNVTVTIYKI